MVAPAPVHVELINEISARYSEGPLSEFEIARYAKAANDLKREFPAAGFCVLGVLACIRRDAEEMRTLHEKSIKISSDPIYIFNYAASLENMKFYGEAMETYLAAVEAGPMVLRHLNRAINLAFKIDHESLCRLLTLWAKLNKGEEHSVRLEIKSRELTRFCMNASTKSLEEVWGGAEESAAWAHLQ